MNIRTWWYLRYSCSSSRTITASACGRDIVVVWIIFLRLAGPFPVHASTSFRGVSFSSMDDASSTICTTCLAYWVMSTVVKSGGYKVRWRGTFTSQKKTRLTHATNLIKTCHMHRAHLLHDGKYHTSGGILHHPTLHQSEQPWESADTFTQKTWLSLSDTLCRTWCSCVQCVSNMVAS